MSAKTMEGKTKIKDIIDAFKSFWSDNSETVTYTMSESEATEVLDSDPNAEIYRQAIDEVENMGNQTEEPFNKGQDERTVISQAGLEELRNRLTGQTKKRDWKTPEITEDYEDEERETEKGKEIE